MRFTKYVLPILVCMTFLSVANAQVPRHTPGDICKLRTGWCWRSKAAVNNAATGECSCRLADLLPSNADLMPKDVWVRGCLDAPSTIMCKNLLPETEKQDPHQFLVSCASNKKISECFTHQESLFKKLGCQVSKGHCKEKSGISNEETIECAYTSSNCLKSSSKSCSPGFNSRWLNGENSQTVCIPTPGRDNTTPQSSHLVQ